MDVIRKCPLFADLNEEELKNAMDFFSCRRRVFKKGEVIKAPGYPLCSFGLVLTGKIQVEICDIDGEQVILATVAAGQTFGESLCFLKHESGEMITALENSCVLMMSTDRIGIAAAKEQALVVRFTAMLASRTLAMNDRIQILSKLTIREKLKVFFSQYAAHSGKTQFSVPFDRTTMAKYLGCERTALSRELSKMRNEGLLTFEKNNFSLINAQINYR